MVAPPELSLRIRKRLLFLWVRLSWEGGSPEVRDTCSTHGDGLCGDSPGACPWGTKLETSLTSQFLEPMNLLLSAYQFELSLCRLNIN